MHIRHHPHLQARTVRESDDDYPAIPLNDNWRVIRCRDNAQWILQFRNRRSGRETVARDDWRGRAYCRTKEALIASCDRCAGVVSPPAAAVLAALADHIDDQPADYFSAPEEVDQ